MKIKSILLLLIFTFAVCEYSDAVQSGRKVISHKLFDIPGGEVPLPGSFPRKVARKNSKAGIINLRFDDAVPDTIAAVMELAADMWGSIIKNRESIEISVLYNPLDDGNVAALVEVGYATDAIPIVPGALQKQIDKNYVLDGSVDGLIELNTDVEWNCSTDATELSAGHNVYTQTLRAIALCLGFGSSVMDYNKSIVYYASVPAAFDMLLFSGNERMADCEDSSPELAAFVTKNPVYAMKQEAPYKMYSPNPFERGRSLVNLDNTQSLMHYGIGDGDKVFRVDPVTIELLNAIGWSLDEQSEVGIISEDVDSTGICSAYSPHTFVIDDKSSSAGNLKWRFKVFSPEGGELILAESTEASFTTPAVENPGQYRKDADGCVEAVVELDYARGGVLCKAHPFRLSMELKPVIKNVYDRCKIPVDGTSLFYATFVVEYYGADKLSVSVEEEYAGAIRTVWSEEPVIAHVKTPALNCLYYSWVDITVSNSYGKATYTIEYEPESGAYRANRMTSLGGFPIVSDANGYVVYNSMGNRLRETDNAEDIRSGLAPGVYIIVSKTGNEVISTNKIVVR